MTLRYRMILALAGGLGLLLSSPAEAHLGLDEPQSRYGQDVLKDAPCGVEGGARTRDRVTVYEPGETITVRWRETVNHPGHYRIAFDPDGVDDLADPACLAGCDTREPTIERDTPGVIVLEDMIPDRDTLAMYETRVTLPDLECDNCTLQVIQVMYDKPPQTRPGNDIYYQCADLVLRRGASEADAGPPPMDMGPLGDAGPPRDLGPEPDLGPPAMPDAGRVVIPFPDRTGCAVVAPGALPRTSWPVVVLLLAAVRRRCPVAVSRRRAGTAAGQRVGTVPGPTPTARPR